MLVGASSARGLRIPDAIVSSPTFVFVNDYPLPAPVRGIAHLIHVDAYRLGGSDEIDSLGWDRFMLEVLLPRATPWCANGPNASRRRLPPPESCVRVAIEHAAESTRVITIDLPESFQGRDGVEAFLETSAVAAPPPARGVEPTRPSYSFAGEKERLADLNKWFTGAYTISRDNIWADHLDAPR